MGIQNGGSRTQSSSRKPRARRENQKERRDVIYLHGLKRTRESSAYTFTDKNRLTLRCSENDVQATKENENLNSNLEGHSWSKCTWDSPQSQTQNDKSNNLAWTCPTKWTESNTSHWKRCYISRQKSGEGFYSERSSHRYEIDAIIFKAGSDLGHKSEVMTDISELSGMDACKGFIFAPRSAIKAQSYWRKLVYIDMCHVFSNESRFIAFIRTLDEEDELIVLAIMHYQNENRKNYVKRLQWFQTNFPEISTSNGLVISADVDKGILPSFENVVPNSILMKFIFIFFEMFQQTSSTQAVVNWNLRHIDRRKMGYFDHCLIGRFFQTLSIE